MAQRVPGPPRRAPHGGLPLTWLHAVLDVPAVRLAAVTDFWAAALGWPPGPVGEAGVRDLEPPTGSAYVHLQPVDGPAGVHLRLEADDPVVTARRAVGLGARLVGEHPGRPVLRSPGGLAVEVVASGRRTPTRPATWPDGHRTRLVQVCIDVPARVAEVEIRFWRALLAGPWAPSDSPEFAGKWHDGAGSPLQVLLQRLDEREGVVRAHLDLGTDDLAAEVGRLRDLGAGEIGPGRGWHALRDPAGTAFCATENDPAHSRVRDLG